MDVDPHTATVTLENGDKVQGDLVIAADGVHVSVPPCFLKEEMEKITDNFAQSRARAKVPGGDVKAFGSGKSAFRFLVPREAALADPRSAKFAAKDGELHITYGVDRRVVVYPCVNNTMLNFNCIHPREESDASAEGKFIDPEPSVKQSTKSRESVENVNGVVADLC